MNKVFQKYRTMSVQVRASFWFLICSFLQKGISSLTTPIFTRLLTTDEYGQYNAFNSWLSIITIFVTLNLFYGVYTQGLVKFEDERKVYSSSLQGLTLTLCLAWTGIYLLFRGFWNSRFSLTTVQMLAMLVMIWATAVFNFWAAEQRVTYSYRRLVLLTLLVSAAKPAVGIFFVLHAHDKVTARILGLALVEIVAYTGLFFVQMARGRVFYSAKIWRYALMFNLPLIPHYLSQTVLSSADRIMIRDMAGGSQAGIYSLAYQLSLIMTLFNTALSQTLSPWIYQKIKADRAGEISQVAFLALGLIAGANLLLMLLAPEAVAVFAPAAYYDAIYVIPPVSMSVFFMFSYDLFAKFEFYFEKTFFIMAASVSGALLNIITNYIFIQRYGYYAAGYTTLFCYLVYAAGHYLMMNRVCDEYLHGERPFPARAYWLMAAAFTVCGFLLLFTYRSRILRYGMLLVAAVLLFVFRRRVRAALRSLTALRKAGKK
ncbi:MAG: oligosaccharide flippase family protein [Eubacteriales bacterium]|nr:oligosaccharide flippase family protein [Eubacteriales bacterium]